MLWNPLGEFRDGREPVDYLFDIFQRPVGQATAGLERASSAASPRERSRAAAGRVPCPTLLALLLALRAVLVPDDAPRLMSVQLTWSDLCPLQLRRSRTWEPRYRRLVAASRDPGQGQVGMRARTS